MKTTLPLLSTLLWSAAFAAPFASPQSATFSDEDRRTKSGFGITVDPVVAGISGLGLLGTGAYIGHQRTKNQYERRIASLSGGAQAASPPPGGKEAAELAEKYRQIDRNIDDFIGAEKSGKFDEYGETRQLERLLGYCVDARKFQWPPMSEAEMKDHCRRKYKMDQDLQPGKTVVAGAIARELETIREGEKKRAREDALKEIEASLPWPEDGRDEKKNPMQMSLAGHKFGVPSSLSINQHQVQQWTQNAQQGVNQVSNAMQNPAVLAPIWNSMRSAQTMPKLRAVPVR